MRYFADLLRRSELLEKLESEVEDLNEAEDGEASEEAHRSTNQPDQLFRKNVQITLNLSFPYKMFAW